MAIRAGEIEPGRYTCPACPARFTELSKKKQHIREEHQD